MDHLLRVFSLTLCCDVLCDTGSSIPTHATLADPATFVLCFDLDLIGIGNRQKCNAQ